MTGDDWAALLPLLLLVVVFWLLILRPARRRQQESAKLQRSLAVGQRVMLNSGIFGTVVRLGDDTFEVDVADGVVLTAHRQAVARVLSPEEQAVQASRDNPNPTSDPAADDGGEPRS